MDLTAKLVIVTGAARRIGRAVALHLAEQGCHIVLHYRRSSDEAAATAEAIRKMQRRCSLIAGDLADASLPNQIITHALAEHGRIDAIVNNAAVFPPTPIDAINADEFAHTLQINLIAPVMLVAAAWPHFKQAGAGKVVNIVDIYAERPRANYIAYCAAKAGLVNATRSMARAMAPIVQVNAVAPGAAQFPEDLDPAAQQRILAKVPLARSGSPSDIAAAVRFLLADADYMTGQVITVDGGRSIAW
jgi:pteridine reductase